MRGQGLGDCTRPFPTNLFTRFGGISDFSIESMKLNDILKVIAAIAAVSAPIGFGLARAPAGGGFDWLCSVDDPALP